MYSSTWSAWIIDNETMIALEIWSEVLVGGVGANVDVCTDNSKLVAVAIASVRVAKIPASKLRCTDLFADG